MIKSCQCFYIILSTSLGKKGLSKPPKVCMFYLLFFSVSFH